MTDYLKLKGVVDMREATLANEIQDNVIEFFDWGLLNIGNYYNVTLGETDTNGVDMSVLRAVEDNPNFADRQAWEGFRGNWVWQSGISYSPAPLVGSDNAHPGVSGVYVNDTFYPSDTVGTYAHKIDHFNGRVIFDTPLPTGSVVKAEFSYKNVNVVYASNLPWLRHVQARTQDVPPHFASLTQGDYNMPPEMRLQLPAIAVEMVPSRRFAPYQLGGGQFTYTDIRFHCVAEDETTVNQLVDIVSQQNDKTIFMFNSNSLAASGAFPLDYQGVPVSGAFRYPELIDGFSNKRLRFENATSSTVNMVNTNFNAGIVRITAEVINPYI